MIDCISVENMRLSDARTIDQHIPSLELMYRAAYGVFLSVSWEEPVAIVAGSGNNGGDGFALACILHKHGIRCNIFTVSSRQSPDSTYYASLAMQAGIPIEPFIHGQNMLHGYAFIVDCLLGTGFHGTMRDHYRSAIEEINKANAYIVSVDINSGMNGDTGKASIAVHSDLTVTIGYVKNGLITEYAGAYIKRLVCIDIGIILEREENKIYSADEWDTVSRMREDSVSKYLPCPSWLDMNTLRVTSINNTDGL